MLASAVALFCILSVDVAPTIRIDRDNIEITESCRVVPSERLIVDADSNGVVHIVGEGITVEFAETPLRGAPAEQPADTFRGYGVRIAGKNVTLRGAKISGYKAAIWASKADGLTIEDCDVSGNFRQRLVSTPAAEDERDWLWPHENDDNQWLKNYGAGIYVEESRNVTIRRNRARRGQNGLCLRAVSESKIYDNDFSFLSGWGIAMFRSGRNVVSRNRCDFCVRGYSHGVYSRGQDSAGFLMFEQCCENVIALNSATHGGDGFFGFAGNDALGNESAAPRVGNNGNLIALNDFSFAPAIGIEMTFSFDNVFAKNKLNGGNYGVWGGYSSDTKVIENEICDNLIAGVAVEHGGNWRVLGNEFARNKVGVQFWWDDDADLLKKPWAQRNNTESRGHSIFNNTFVEDQIAIELTGGTKEVGAAGNIFRGVGSQTKVDEKSEIAEPPLAPLLQRFEDERLADLPGEQQAVGSRAQLAGREHIVITEWGPYDWEEGKPCLIRTGGEAGAHAFRLLGDRKIEAAAASGAVRVSTDADEASVSVRAERPATITPYELTVKAGGEKLSHRGTLVAASWDVLAFSWKTDPRENVEAWRRDSESGLRYSVSELNLPFGGGDPARLAQLPTRLAADRFGIIATTELTFPAGRWRIRTVSDDGIRVHVNGELKIDNWTHHVPTTDRADVQFEAASKVPIRVEYFELDGYATLQLTIEPIEAE